jgi:purine catabolism regulator
MGLVAVQHVASLVAFELDRRHGKEQIADGYRARLLCDILTGELSPSATRRHLQEEGLDLDESLVLAALPAEGQNAPDDVTTDRWCARLRRLRVPHLMVRLDCVYVLLPDRPDGLQVLEAEGVLVGVSRPFSLRDGHGLARREAALALHAATRTGRRLVRWGSDVDHPVALPADQDSLERLVASVLGGINEYDRTHHSDLTASLRSYLEHDRGVRAAAKELFIHPNSLAYRLRRIEEITGKRLSSIKAQTDFWLALEAQRFLAVSSQDGASNGKHPAATVVS